MILTTSIFHKITFFKFAIKCNFTYNENMENYPIELVNSLLENPVLNDEIKIKTQEFLCDDDDDVGVNYDRLRTGTSQEEVQEEFKMTKLSSFREQEIGARKFYHQTTKIKSSSILETFLRSDFVPWASSARPMPTTRIPEQKFDSNLEEEHEALCESVRRIVYPATLPNILNRLVTIVKSEKITQSVWIDECT